ncbi:MAG TPA: hypothetical protein VHA13_03005 [Gammaproteobacteria bacterium]|nr:hypothetical protein [Gammaproteobacteria bacterium]
MDSKEKRLVVLLLSIAFTMMFAGYLFVPFVVHFWTYIANLAGEKDVFLACTLLIYFTMFALFGATIGILINAYGSHVTKGTGNFIRKKLGQK